MPSEVRLKKKKTEQLKEGLKSSILGPQNLGSGGAQAPRAPLDPLVCLPLENGTKLEFSNIFKTAIDRLCIG